MRTAGLSLLVALAAITVNGDVTCNIESPLPATSATFLPGLQDRLSSILAALCQTPPEELGTVKYSEGLVLELRRSKTVQDAKECQVAFAAIISQCIETGKASGGESHADEGITYLVYSGNPGDHHLNHARAPAPPKPAKPVPAPVKPKPAPAKPSPAPAKPFKIGPTKNCAQLAVLMQTPTGKGKRSDDIEEARGQFVGSRVDVKSRDGLAKRAAGDDDEWDGPGAADTLINHEGRPKKGSACGITFDALNYPKAAAMPASAPFFSIDSPDNNCEVIKYQEIKTAVLGVKKYHIEHILEWQTVAKFFDWMDRKLASKKFKNPDPTKSGDLNFCDYLKEQWKGSYPQPITINGKSLSPIEHMAQAYPGVGNREDEFVWLQATMNTPAKSNMWAYKGAKDASGTLHSAEKMREYITGEKTVVKGQKVEKVAGDLVDRAKIALLKLKALMGARMYMRSKTVSDIFKKQVDAIGKMLADIETELPKHPRLPPADRKKIDPWIKQDLSKHWTEYMNERFEIAHKRTHNDMDTYLKLLDEKWCKGRPKTPTSSPPKTPAGSRPGTPTTPTSPINNLADLFGAIHLNGEDVALKDLCRFYEKVQTAWTAEKAKPWTKPW